MYVRTLLSLAAVAAAASNLEVILPFENSLPCMIRPLNNIFAGENVAFQYATYARYRLAAC